MKETKQVSSVEIFVQDWKALQPVQSFNEAGRQTKQASRFSGSL
jgi:hypothetical protein